jgi:hypothetical protein
MRYIIATILTLSPLLANYPVVDTNQKDYFSDHSYSTKPTKGSKYYGQDAQYNGHQPSYKDNNNGTITDNVTGLMWQKGYKKMSYSEAIEYAKSAKIAGYSDWRVPTIKELYSLIDFSGTTGSGGMRKDVPSDAKPYINTKYFDFEYSTTQRYIDVQFVTSTDSVVKTMGGDSSFFGVNFADGRIKAYPKYNKGRGAKEFYIRLVRGGDNYGKNHLVDRGEIIVDLATKLMWTKSDSQRGMDWGSALEYCERLSVDGFDDWRLPNAKELQSIVDYSSAPSHTNSPAISSKFETTSITNENGQKDYPYFWTSTTHLDGRDLGSNGVYIAFGRALGYMQTPSGKQLLEVHGAGAQRSDPKSGRGGSRGPQGDVMRVSNYARCVSDSYTTLDSEDYLPKKVITSHKRPSRGEFDMDREFRGERDFRHMPPPPNGEFGMHRPPHREDMSIVDMLDRDQDGKISIEEAPRMMQKNFRKHDTNGDGYIDKEEAESLPQLR